ncbi:hypothetical protein KZ852_32405, partial [Pseudomonas aeruginosa]|nr:hypothetical protein [Pseudomonas aeruginosa]
PSSSLSSSSAASDVSKTQVAHLAPWLMRGRLPALGPDLTLILCGALLIRYAWMQARAAAPPAHPRVTGDHHA